VLGSLWGVHPLATAVCEAMIEREWLLSFLGKSGKYCVIEMYVGATLLLRDLSNRTAERCIRMIDVRLPWHMLGVHR
jgi:hypothetical protein